MIHDNVTAKALFIIQRRQRHWRFARWLMLVGGLVCMAVGAWGAIGGIDQLQELSSAARDMPEVALFLSSMATSMITDFKFVAFLGVLAVARAVSHWQGDPTDLLLIQLMKPGNDAPSTAA